MWKLFDKSTYHYCWHKNNIIGVAKRFGRDIKYSIQRIKKGYCDEDLFSISDWFLEIIPDMLVEFKENRMGSPASLGENYTNDDGVVVNDNCHQEWDEILDQMIHYFNEANESKCSKTNPNEPEYRKVTDEFIEKFGFFGEKLETDKEKEESEKTGLRVWHTASEIPEYKPVVDQFIAGEAEVFAYRDECKNKAFHLFAKWFWNLWD